MNTNVSDLQIAFLFIVVAAALVWWFRSKLAAASRSRMYRMMARLGVDPNRFSEFDENTGTNMKAIRTRCRMCPSEDVCERWLAGEIEGDNGFCPNAKVFDGVVRTG
jgi:hypothetical protein